MRVVHCNIVMTGGAGRAAYRIHEAVTLSGADSSMLFVNGDKEENSIAWHWREQLKYKLNCRLIRRVLRKNGGEGLFSPDIYGFDISGIPQIKDADIIHLHLISDGMFSVESLGKLADIGKPVIWTMHDMNPFTGGCHYSEECTKFKNECASCPILEKCKNERVSTLIQKKKEKSYGRLKLYPVGCSQWITECAKQSRLLKDFHPRAIPNPINTDVFNVIDKKTARELLGFPLDKKLILFGAVKASSEKRKGFSELCKAIKGLNKEEYVCVIFGEGGAVSSETGIDVINLGAINDDFHLKCVYNAVDVFVCPSLYENLANTVMESLSCGTPVAAFDTGGMKDMIIHRENGYLASYRDSGDLQEGIVYCSSNDLRDNARRSVQNRFSYEIIGGKYMDLYRESLK